MSNPEEDKISISGDYEIIDPSCFNSSSVKPNLEFHLNFPCPVCGSFQGHFICAQCVNSGSFTSSRRQSKVTYAALSTRLSIISQEIRSVNESLTNCGLPKTDPCRELKELVEVLNSSITYNKEQNKKKRECLDRVHQSISLCSSELRQINKRKAEVFRRSSSVSKKRLILSKKMATLNAKIEAYRVNYLKELLIELFPVHLASNKQSPDEFVRAALLIDRVNAFVGPEPICSSQTVLTYCIPVILAAAKFLDIWLPPVLVERLRLSGPLLATLPQRDTLGHTYSPMLHAIHLLCASRLIDVRTRMELFGSALHPTHSEYNPLLGLYCLGRAEALKDFSGPYELKLDGLFGTLLPPGCEDLLCLATLRQLRLQDVEQGEEAKELDETEDDRSTAADSSATTSATVISTVSDLSSTVPISPTSKITVERVAASENQGSGSVQHENWEFVADGVHLPSVDSKHATDIQADDTWTVPLGAFLRIAFQRPDSHMPDAN